MKTNQALILCITTHQMQSNKNGWKHFILDEAPNHFIRIMPKDIVKPQGNEALIVEDLTDTNPNFSELFTENEVIQEIREAQIPLIMECYFDAAGNCTYVSYLSASYIDQHPEIDDKLCKLSYTIRQLNISDHIRFSVPDHADYWKFNIIVH